MCISTGVHTEALKIHKIYAGVGTGFPWLFSADVTYLSKRNIGLSVNYNMYALKSANLPSDYTSDFYGAFGNPKDKFKAFSLLFVIDIRRPKQKLRPGFEAGLSWISYEEANYQRQDPGWGVIFGATQNYEVTYTSEWSTGFQVRAKLEVLFNHILGCEIALTGNINKYRSFVGIEAIFLIGRVREKTMPAY